MSIAHKALNAPWKERGEILATATQVQEFTRCTVYSFTDGSRLTVNMFSASYAEAA